VLGCLLEKLNLSSPEYKLSLDGLETKTIGLLPNDELPNTPISNFVPISTRPDQLKGIVFRYRTYR